MKETELIERLTRGLPTADAVRVGPGDDCAVLDMGLPGQWILFKTDAVVEGIHFAADAPPENIGRKALARALSDIAAMAGTPAHALVTLGLADTHAPERIEGIYRGMADLARQHGVAIVGGETTTNPVLMISVALLGTVQPSRCVRRKGSQAGDALFVSGSLGGSLQGRHLDFEPRLPQARWLAEHFLPHAMIDLSDGLASDLRHLLAGSACGAELLTSAIPISAAARKGTAKTPGKSPLLSALTDGEDYELLFSVAPGHAVPLLDAWKGAFPDLRLSCIGRITHTPGIILRDADGSRPLTAHGYVHFQKP